METGRSSSYPPKNSTGTSVAGSEGREDSRGGASNTLCLNVVLMPPVTSEQQNIMAPNSITSESTLAVGFSANLHAGKLWRSFGRHYDAVVRRYVWVDQQLALRKVELAKVVKEKDERTTDRDRVAAELAQTKEKLRASEKRITEMNSQLAEVKRHEFQKYLESPEYKAKLREAEEATRKAYAEGSEFHDVLHTLL